MHMPVSASQASRIEQNVAAGPIRIDLSSSPTEGRTGALDPQPACSTTSVPAGSGFSNDRAGTDGSSQSAQ
jgi:hypothetical protein